MYNMHVHREDKKKLGARESYLRGTKSDFLYFSNVIISNHIVTSVNAS